MSKTSDWAQVTTLNDSDRLLGVATPATNPTSVGISFSDLKNQIQVDSSEHRLRMRVTAIPEEVSPPEFTITKQTFNDDTITVTEGGDGELLIASTNSDSPLFSSTNFDLGIVIGPHGDVDNMHYRYTDQRQVDHRIAIGSTLLSDMTPLLLMSNVVIDIAFYPKA